MNNHDRYQSFTKKTIMIMTKIRTCLLQTTNYQPKFWVVWEIEHKFDPKGRWCFLQFYFCTVLVLYCSQVIHFSHVLIFTAI